MAEIPEVPAAESAPPVRRPLLLRICGFGPGLLLAAIFLGLAAVRFQSAPAGQAALGVGGLGLLGICAIIGHGILFEIRWRLLEFTQAVFIGCVPAGLYSHSEQGLGLNDKWIAVVAFLIAGQLFSLTCTLVGLSMAHMLGEERTYPRLGLILAAWGALAGGVSLFLAAFLSLFVLGFSLLPSCVGLWICGLAGIACWVLLLALERKAHRMRRAAEAAEAALAK
ncbi:MAG: hypothetical protein HY291_02755 [Planctomycetes bacterium]|nr:hypothetical protein [Planctomycetota bacterium]